MKISVHSLYHSNINPLLVESHKKVHEHFDIPVIYENANVRHGLWMDNIIRNTNSDIFVFCDIDCVPIHAQAFERGISYVTEKDSFIGPAQASNHIHPKSHIFASPAYFFITKTCYEKIGSPTFAETQRSDVAEEVSYVSEEKGNRYRCWYPDHFDASPLEGIWRLSNYGYYGIGTVFGGNFYHLFQSRFNANVDLFAKRCQQIIDNKFVKDTAYDSLGEFTGRVVP